LKAVEAVAFHRPPVAAPVVHVPQSNDQLPIALHHRGIDGLPNLLAGLPDNVGNILKEQVRVIRGLCVDICLIGHIAPLPKN